MALNFYFLKNAEIFKLNFLDFWLIDFFLIFSIRRGVDALSMCKIKEKSYRRNSVKF